MAAASEGRRLRVVGTPVRKVDGLSKCAGVTKFADDIVRPRMLFCKLHRSPVPHARIVRVDTSKAERMPGVLAVLAGQDLPIPLRSLPASEYEHALWLDKVPLDVEP